MGYYDIMFEAITERYESGDITFEQANELNVLAYENATADVSKFQEEKFIKEYQDKLDAFKKSVEAIKSVPKKDFTKSKMDALFKNANKKLDEVDDMLSDGKMPKVMSNRVNSKSGIIAGALIGGAIWNSVIEVVKRQALKEIREDQEQKSHSNVDKHIEHLDKRGSKYEDDRSNLSQMKKVMSPDEYKKWEDLHNQALKLRRLVEADADSRGRFRRDEEKINKEADNNRKIIKNVYGGSQLAGTAALVGTAAYTMLGTNRNNVIVFRNKQKKQVMEARRMLNELEYATLKAFK